MSNQLQQQLDELKEKKKPTGTERAQIKVLERKIKQSKKETNAEDKSKTNVFATKKPTTKINPLPVRLIQTERDILTNVGNRLKTDSIDMVIDILGTDGLKDINDTKLLRAAAYLLAEASDTQILEAIKESKLNMIR
ncbi:hypothetical protein A6E13_16395 [Aliivibrio fischeri]|uniref:hypothetical protein n=1 Tax=Aliivibrio fischeri TaxID=668 RepID=UPI00080ED490|nr:hypothetical protein [Aliivibrio fischeri]OCH31802.1 hypothetical protein A6E13_16395 [Aliivibrio fischeri]